MWPAPSQPPEFCRSSEGKGGILRTLEEDRLESDGPNAFGDLAGQGCLSVGGKIDKWGYSATSLQS